MISVQTRQTVCDVYWESAHGGCIHFQVTNTQLQWHKQIRRTYDMELKYPEETRTVLDAM